MKTVANRETIADVFKTDDITTNRILNNCGWGFFQTQFGDDADNKWKEAHPFFYAAHPSINYHEVDIEFLRKHFLLFSGKQFFTSAGWKFNSIINKMEWAYESGYIEITSKV